VTNFVVLVLVMALSLWS